MKTLPRKLVDYNQHPSHCCRVLSLVLGHMQIIFRGNIYITYSVDCINFAVMKMSFNYQATSDHSFSHVPHVCWILIYAENEDYAPLWKILSININSQQGDLFCFYVDIFDDDVPEEVEYFDVHFELFDINAQAIAERSVAYIFIHDNDRLQGWICNTYEHYSLKGLVGQT